MRTFFLAAVCLFVLASAADVASKVKYGNAAVGIASAAANRSEGAATGSDLQAGKWFQILSCCLALAAICSWIASAGRKERCHHGVLVVLLVVFGLLQLVVV